MNGAASIPGSLVGAAILILFGIALALPVFVRRFRGKLLWGDEGELHMSAFGHAAWSLFAFASAVVLAADGLHIIPVSRHWMSILGGALGVVFLAALVDALSRRKKKP